MHRKFIAIGALLAAVAVGLGAFGAHALKKMVEADSVQTFQTGVQYQLYHALAIIITGILFEKKASGLIQYAGWFFIGGIILFSGSLYLLTFFKAAGTVGFSKLGLITPFGGIAFILGWVCLFLSIRKQKLS